MEIIRTLVSVYSVTVMLCHQSHSTKCRPHNKNDTLEYVNPDINSTSDYPPSQLIILPGSVLTVACCATGFNSITWFVDDVKQGPPNLFTHYYTQDNQGIVLFTQFTPGEHKITCTLEGENDSTISHTQIASAPHTCLPANSSGVLQFIDPASLAEERGPYPATSWRGVADRPLIIGCCGTGFADIYWYYDGKRLQESSDEYMISQQKQLLTLFSLEAGNHTVICKLINGNASISNRLQLYAAGPMKPDEPVFVRVPQDQCVDVNSTVILISEAMYYTNATNILTYYSRYIMLQYENGTNLNLGSEHISRQIIRRDAGRNVTVVFKLTDTPADWLNRLYRVQLSTNSEIRALFNLTEGPCKHRAELAVDIQTSNPTVTITTTCITVVGVILLLVGIALGIMFHPEIELLRRKNLHWTANKYHDKVYQYDIYLIYNDNDMPCVSAIIGALEAQYSLCLPDRDFAIGSVTPTELTNKMRESRYVVTVLTSDLLSRELEWTDLALGLMLKLNKPLALVSFGQINKRILRRNRDLLTAFRVCGHITFVPEHTKEFYEQLNEKQLFPMQMCKV